MEVFIIGVVIIAGLVLFFGGLDNNRPVGQWSDEKLKRMHKKLLHSSELAHKANKPSEALKLSQKADEVKNEIQRRGKELSMQYANALDDSFKDVKNFSLKRKEIIELQKEFIKENGITEEKYDEELSLKMNQMVFSLQEKYMKTHNLTQLEALEKANEEVLNYPVESFIIKFKLYDTELSVFEIGYMSVNDITNKGISSFLTSIEKKIESSSDHGNYRLLNALKSDPDPVAIKIYLACANSAVYYFILMAKNKKHRDHKNMVHDQFYLGVKKGLEELLGQIKALENSTDEFNNYLNSSLGLYVTNSRAYAEFAIGESDIYSPYMSIILGMYKYYQIDIHENIQERDKVELALMSQSTLLMEKLSDNFVEI